MLYDLIKVNLRELFLKVPLGVKDEITSEKAAMVSNTFCETVA